MDTQVENHLQVFREQLNNLVVFNDDEWAVFKSHLRLKKLAKKEHLTHIGDTCKEVGFILTGSVRLYHIRDGNEITSYFSLAHDFISSYKSFVKQEPGLSSIQALEDTHLIIFTYQSMQQLLNNPVTAYKMERFGRLIAEYLVCCYEERVLSFVMKTPEERYATLLSSNSRILQHISQHYLANYLGITPVSLSRIRKRIFETVK